MTTRSRKKTVEHQRFEEARLGTKWRRWGTYLGERQWGTVREDYSDNGDAWGYSSLRRGLLASVPAGAKTASSA